MISKLTVESDWFFMATCVVGEPPGTDGTVDRRLQKGLLNMQFEFHGYFSRFMVDFDFLIFLRKSFCIGGMIFCLQRVKIDGNIYLSQIWHLVHDFTFFTSYQYLFQLLIEFVKVIVAVDLVGFFGIKKYLYEGVLLGQFFIKIFVVFMGWLKLFVRYTCRPVLA